MSGETRQNSADSDAPDFDRLARETPWSRVQWVLAWKTLDERCDWGVLRDFAKANRMSPDSAARMLNEALAVPDPWDTRPTTPVRGGENHPDTPLTNP